MPTWDSDLQRLMIEAAVPGAASTVIQHGQPAEFECFGVLDIRRTAPVDAIAQRLVFGPLGMMQTSYVWQDRFDSNRAFGHDAFGMPALSHKPGEANAAWTLQTCAADYGRFLRAVVDGAGLSAENARLWLMPHVDVTHRGIQCLDTVTEHVETGVAWGLGWGLEPSLGTFFHWGDNGPFTSFTLGSLRERSAFVVFTNAASGHSVVPQIVERFMPGIRPSLNWLDYVRHDAPVRRLLRQALVRGAEATWPEIEEAGLDRDKIVWIAQGLNAKGQEKECLWLRARLDVK